MNNLRRLPLDAVLATALVLTAALSTIFTGSNPSQFSTGILEASYAESTALHCSGLTSSVVTFFNTTSDPHKISITWISAPAQLFLTMTNWTFLTVIILDTWI